MAEGRRILFAIPWGERVILGTTDTDYDGPLDDVPHRAGRRGVHPGGGQPGVSRPPSWGRPDVISTWAGLRPLIAVQARGGPSDISRAHQIAMPEPGWFDVAGGKLTTYRLIAEQVVDRIVRPPGPEVPALPHGRGAAAWRRARRRWPGAASCRRRSRASWSSTTAATSGRYIPTTSCSAAPAGGTT